MKARALFPSLLVLTSALAFWIGVLLSYDAWRVRHLSEAEVRQTYHFGAEAMVAEGGEKYRSREAYLAASDRTLLVTFGIAAGAFALAGLTMRQSPRPP